MVASYREEWDRKRQWYSDNGYLGRLITLEDGPDGSIDASAIERTAIQFCNSAGDLSEQNCGRAAIEFSTSCHSDRPQMDPTWAVAHR